MFAMKQHGLDARQLLRMLSIALRKQKELWTPIVYKPVNNQAVEIGPENRDETVRWLAHLNKKLRFHPETLALSVVVLDRFLSVVKAHAKYLKIIGVACLYLSAKTVEEDVMVPQTLEFIRESKVGCSIAEILRMERVILDKLSWDLRAVTPIEFMQLFQALLMLNYPLLLNGCVQMTPSRQMTLLTRKLHLCMAYSGLLGFSPATVALTVLSQELELFHKDWFAITAGLQSMVEIDSDSLILCREKVTCYLSTIGHPHTIYLQSPIKHHAPSSPSHANKAAKRKVKDIEESDDVYDAIKRLYNDDEQHSVSTGNNTTATIGATCSSEFQQDSTMSAIALQAVVN